MYEETTVKNASSDNGPKPQFPRDQKTRFFMGNLLITFFSSPKLSENPLFLDHLGLSKNGTGRAFWNLTVRQHTPQLTTAPVMAWLSTLLLSLVVAGSQRVAFLSFARQWRCGPQPHGNGTGQGR